MKRKTVALMTALILSISLSSCGNQTPVSNDTTDTESVAETTKETEETEEVTTSEETEEDIAQKEMEKLQSALGDIPYYGDTSNCKMTAEQATAYAQLLADGLAGDFSFRGGYDEKIEIISWDTSGIYIREPGYTYDIDRFNVMLGDFSYDGIPYLYVYGSENDELDSFEIYGWKNNVAELLYDTLSEYSSIAHNTYNFFEDEDEDSKLKMSVSSVWGIGEEFIEYSFIDGDMVDTYILEGRCDMDDAWYIKENGVETGAYTNEEYYALMGEYEEVDKRKRENHTHILPYTCFYDMQPCTLEEMINYLNAYASIMSDGQSVPVEIKKPNIIKHEGTGITTKGEVAQWKVDSLEILRQYMNEELAIAFGNADSALYASETKNFYFGLEDINNDGIQELLLSYKNDVDAEYGKVQIHFPPSYVCLANVYGFDSTNNTYMISEGSVYEIDILYTYDGTSLSELSRLEGDWEDYEVIGEYTITENGEKRELDDEEFQALVNDWKSRHTRISTHSINIHLDIDNIESTFQVKIDILNLGEWLVTNME